MIEVDIQEYENEYWNSVCRIHNLARTIELKGSCDERAFIPLAEDVGDLQNFNVSRKHVARYKNAIVGFAGTRENEITWLYVDPRFFGQGIGRLLLERAVKSITGVPYLYVLSENHAAISLYHNLGFVEVERSIEKENGYSCTVLKLLKRE